MNANKFMRKCCEKIVGIFSIKLTVSAPDGPSFPSSCPPRTDLNPLEK